MADFHSGRLADPTLVVISIHIATCSACEFVMLELGRQSADGLGQRLRRCLQEDDPKTLSEPAYQAMALAVAAIPANDLMSGGVGESTSERARFVTPPYQQIGPYQVLGPAGSGGMGVVYRAQHQTLNRVVALKMLRSGACASEDALTRFRTEAEAVARLHHPNVAQIYDFGEHGGLPYFAMEWVGGGTLARKLSAGPLGFNEAAEIVRTVALAVDDAHRRQIIHRDLKPGNILLATDGTPKVADFGLAKILDTEGDRVTLSGVIVGTPSYMSPEQVVSGGSDVGPLTDVYALGAILYETLSGKPPHVAKTKHETLEMLVSREVVPPSRLRPDLPADLEAVCLKCLEKCPGRRYSSAGALAEDLGRWLKGEPTRARPLGRLHRTIRMIRRWWRSSAIALLVIGTVAAIAAIVARDRVPVAAVDDELVEAWPGNHNALVLFERELLQGRKVTLVDEGGQVQWYRWLNGAQPRQSVGESGGALSVSHTGAGLLELLPDPVDEAYCVRAQVRHDRTLRTHNGLGEGAEVGVFVGHTLHPRPPNDVHSVVQLTFDTVSVPPTFANANGATLATLANQMRLFPRLLIGRGELGNDKPLDGPGHAVKPLGPENGKWFDLELTVTPGDVCASVGGRKMVLARSGIESLLNEQLLRPWKGTAGLSTRLSFVPRAGLGLVITGGTGSFKNVTVEPLPVRR